MDLLNSNRYLLDMLAEKFLEQDSWELLHCDANLERVNGEELMQMANKAAAENKLVIPNTQMAVASFAGEVDAKKSQCLHPDVSRDQGK
mmetsp:Transcript_2537/g.6044  ORF Transcript_2537/g.6044 Transcript_2537/m.6044 type:complete len:89 (+) Transcript_2537:25-291(+)